MPKYNSDYLIKKFAQVFGSPDVPPFELRLPDGATHRFGAENSEPDFKLLLRNDNGVRALAALDDNATGEAYMFGDIDLEGDFLSAFKLRAHFSDVHPMHSLWRYLRPLFLGQVKHDKSAIPKHYDRGNEFYFTFVDKKHKLYSQALFKSEDNTLEQAAENKLQYVKEICRLKPASDVLDVGAGWGSFARFASSFGIDVDMMTISHEQFEYLKALAKDDEGEGVLNPIYESIYAYNTDKQYDAAVLLGSPEHLPDYKALFKQFEKLIKPHGFVYMDFVATRVKFNISTFTYRYVFEGNHTPVVMPKLLEAMNESSFEIAACHNDRHSYYLTAKHWAQRLEANRDDIVREYGEESYRLFQLYLWSVANCLLRDGDLESYRIAFQKSMGDTSDHIGVYTPI